MSAREQFLLDLLSDLAPSSKVVVGRCAHTCKLRANMGQKHKIKIGMRYHYCPMCKFSFKHDLEPHDAKTRQLLRDALAAWNESQKAAKKIGRPNVPKVKSPKKDRRSPPAPAQRPIYATTTSTALVDLDRLNGQGDPASDSDIEIMEGPYTIPSILKRRRSDISKVMSSKKGRVDNATFYTSALATLQHLDGRDDPSSDSDIEIIEGPFTTSSIHRKGVHLRQGLVDADSDIEIIG